MASRTVAGEVPRLSESIAKTWASGTVRAGKGLFFGRNLSPVHPAEVRNASRAWETALQYQVQETTAHFRVRLPSRKGAFFDRNESSGQKPFKPCPKARLGAAGILTRRHSRACPENLLA